MDDAVEYPDLVTRILAICKDTFGTQFSQYYEGDPVTMPKANLPCVIVEVISSDIIGTNMTGYDSFTDRISIKLLLDKDDDVNKTDSVDLTERRLRRFVQGRDPVTNRYLSDTLMYALRNDFTFAQYIYNSEVSINYDVRPRPMGVVTSEAQVVVTAQGNIQRN